MNWLPIVPLFRDASVSSDVLTYARVKRDWKLEKDLYPQVYGRLGGEVVSSVVSLIPGGTILPYYTKPVLTGAGSIAGAATGKAMADNREKLITPLIQR